MNSGNNYLQAYTYCVNLMDVSVMVVVSPNDEEEIISDETYFCVALFTTFH